MVGQRRVALHSIYWLSYKSILVSIPSSWAQPLSLSTCPTFRWATKDGSIGSFTVTDISATSSCGRCTVHTLYSIRRVLSLSVIIFYVLIPRDCLLNGPWADHLSPFFIELQHEVHMNRSSGRGMLTICQSGILLAVVLALLTTSYFCWPVTIYPIRQFSIPWVTWDEHCVL